MEEIERIVARMEKETLPLEESLALFEQGVALIRDCQAYLGEARQKVTVLMSDGAESDLSEDGE
jgi:exodeoxyribonuclease VII small subunit